MGIAAGTGDILSDPQLITTGDARFHIQDGSPCIDAGDDTAVASDWLDMDCTNRKYGDHVDMGADEYDGTAYTTNPVTIRVSKEGNDTNTGLNWDQSKLTVQSAVDAAASQGGEVWVAKGVYSEAIVLRDGVSLYGGFSGIESSLSQRNWKDNITTLDGSKGTVITISGATVAPTRLNGFVISKCKSGNGIYCTGGSPEISNNVITQITYSAIVCNTGGPGIFNNFLVANGSGGIFCLSSSPSVANNTIAANGGVGISCFASSPTVRNNVISFNSTGIALTDTKSVPVLSNNCVYNPEGVNYSGLAAGSGDISVDPKLVAFEYGQVHILPGSLCIDAGDDNVAAPDWLDIDCGDRVLGNHVDIGADEFDGTAGTFTPTTVRISPSGDDSNDGSSWMLAKKTIQAGIDAAAVNGGEVWVQAGVYPEQIKLKHAVYVYGGFAGSEDYLYQRDWRLHKSVLDGSGGGEVVSASGIGWRCSAIDGFTIRNGKSKYGNVYCSYASVNISNNTIYGCVLTSDAGGHGISCVNSSTKIVGNTLFGNYGSGISIGYGATAGYSAPSILNNLVAGNASGIYLNKSGGITANNVIAGNNSSGVYCVESTTAITNNTIVANTGDGIYLAYSPVPITNDIIAFNGSGIEWYKANSSTEPVLYNNCVYNPNGQNYIAIAAGVGDISIDPRFVSLECGQLHIMPSSACIDAGTDAALAPGWLDMDGNTRLYGDHVDIGADEYDGTVWAIAPAIVRVSPSGDDANDGSSWEFSKKTIQSALDSILMGGEIWVAAGTYHERLRTRPFTHLYGGFAGHEEARLARDWRTNRTILNADAMGSVVTVVGGRSDATIDGFLITNGYAPSGTSAKGGAAIDCSTSSAIISHNTIIGNQGGKGSIYCSNSLSILLNNVVVSNIGSGIFCDTSSATIANNVIGGNTETGISCSNSDGNPFLIASNTITANDGAAIYLSNCTPTVANNILAFGNFGLRNDSSTPATPVLVNNCVYNPLGTNYTGMSAGTSDISVDP